MTVRWSATWFCISVLFALASCRSKAPVAEVETDLPPTPETVSAPPSDYAPAAQRVLTVSGHNSQPAYSPDGKWLVFVSQKRPQHAQAQVYLLNIETGKEKRLTFQDGQTSSPLFDGSGKRVFYASSTDEHKENPPYIQRALAELAGAPPDKGDNAQTTWPPTEIYVSGVDGAEIRRLTRRPGFDGEASLDARGSGFVFTSARDGRLALYVMEPDGSRVRVLVQGPEHNFQPALSPDGRELLWVRQTDDRNEAQLFAGDSRGRSQVQVSRGPGRHVNPTWHPDGEHVIYSSTREDGNFELFQSRKDGRCPQRLTYTAAHELQARVSPDGKHLVFTSQKDGSSQIHTMDLIPPKTCPDAAP